MSPKSTTTAPPRSRGDGQIECGNHDTPAVAAPDSVLDQVSNGAHSERVEHGNGQMTTNTQVRRAAAVLDEGRHATQSARVERGSTNSGNGQTTSGTQGLCAVAAPNSVPDGAHSNNGDGHGQRGTHGATVVADPDSVPDPIPLDTHGADVGDGPTCPPAATPRPMPLPAAPLVDKPLAVIAELVTDLEDLRKAYAARLSIMTRAEVDKDGEERGWALPDNHPAVVSVRAMVESVTVVEKHAIRDLQRMFHATPLGPWVKAQHGLGAKTMARLLSATGDPYWNNLHGRPRTVSELWSYCGYGKPGQRRKRGERTNYSPTAKMRMHNVVEPVTKIIIAPCYVVYADKVTSEPVRKEKGKPQPGPYWYAVHVEGECVCSPYRVMWDEARAKYRDTTHPEPCAQCAPKGSPAPAGSPRSAAHQAAMADRIVKKAILKDLWREARRLYELSDGQGAPAPHTGNAVGELSSTAGQRSVDTHVSHASGGPTSEPSGGQGTPGRQRERAAGVSSSAVDQCSFDAHPGHASGSLTPGDQNTSGNHDGRAAGHHTSTADQNKDDAQRGLVGSGLPGDQTWTDAQRGRVAASPGNHTSGTASFLAENQLHTALPDSLSRRWCVHAERDNQWRSDHHRRLNQRPPS